MKRYKIWPLVLAVLFAAAVFLTPRVFADDACTIAGESDPLICGTPESDEEVALMETVKSVLNTVYLWIGILSVIFIVVGGIHYMTSTGEAEKIKHAKATITYSIIGLVVTLAAFAITNFVVGALEGNAPGDKVASSPDDTFGENRKKVKAITAISKTTLTTGQTITLKARIIPDYAQNKDLSYASSNSEVATVDEDGEVEAKKPGNTTITIASADGPKTNVNITVKEPIQVNGIQLSETRVSLEKGKSVTIKATVLPKNAADQTVTWTSSNPKVATVSQSGTIKGIIDGKTTVTVKSKNGKTAKVAVTVSSDIVQTQENTENKKFSGHLDFRPETRKIVD
ncbi:Ig-like domain-containing protein, partial [Candidatus Saccharibacteria bacterium]|nr:Ig-like domain-containing protein [Candidatus Saccharibacteria bacterium]